MLYLEHPDNQQRVVGCSSEGAFQGVLTLSEGFDDRDEIDKGEEDYIPGRRSWPIDSRAYKRCASCQTETEDRVIYSLALQHTELR
jgi:hypothetical protein